MFEQFALNLSIPGIPAKPNKCPVKYRAGSLLVGVADQVLRQALTLALQAKSAARSLYARLIMSGRPPFSNDTWRVYVFISDNIAKGYDTPAQAYIAGQLQLCRQFINQACTVLKDAGWLDWTNRRNDTDGQMSNRYRLLTPAAAAAFTASTPLPEDVAVNQADRAKLTAQHREDCTLSCEDVIAWNSDFKSLPALDPYERSNQRWDARRALVPTPVVDPRQKNNLPLISDRERF